MRRALFVVASALVATATLLGPSVAASAATEGPSTSSTTTAVPRAAAAGQVPADFYTVPDPLPAGNPGDLIRSEVVTSPSDVTGTTYRVMYHSRSVTGADIAVTGLVAVPAGTAPAGGWPVVSWAHGTTGLADVCAPSKDVDLEGTGFLTSKGYLVAATDYEGLGTPGRHPYIVGVSEARGTIDAVRAARNLPGVVASTHWLVWGHSQGGHAALWTSQIASAYAPELQLVGTVAGAPPSQLNLVYQALTGSFFRYYLLMAAAGINAAYPDAKLDQVITPAALDKLGIIDTACGSDVGVPYAGMPTSAIIKVDFNTVEPWASLVKAQEPGTVKTDNPILIIHGGADEQIPTVSSQLLEQRMCGFGQVVSRRVYPGQSHTSVIPVSMSDQLVWMRDRFAGLPAPNDCAPTAYVHQAVSDVLGRAPTAFEQAQAVAALGAPATPQSKAPWASRLTHSAEAYAVDVRALYQELLHREGDPAGVVYFEQRLRDGATTADVAAAMLASPEMWPTINPGGFPPAADLAARWYQRALGRTATQTGVDYWAGVIRTEGVAVAAARFANTPERRGVVVTQVFGQLLGRSLSGAGRDYYVGRLRTVDVAGVQADLLTSFEYDERANRLAT